MENLVFKGARVGKQAEDERRNGHDEEEAEHWDLVCDD